jgi:hypothetical protein
MNKDAVFKLKKGVTMKIRFLIICCAVFVCAMSLVDSVYAQNANCVITEKQGSLATVSCPGVGTRTENLGGAADRYKVGDTISVPDSSRDRGQSSPVDPRSGRR